MTRIRDFKQFQDLALFPFKYAFPIKTMVGFGILVGAYLPRPYAVAVATAMMGGTVLTSLLSRLGLYTDPMSRQVLKGRKMAKIEGDFVVFHIGARPNRHIDGFMKWMGDAMETMLQELEDSPKELGYLGGEQFVGATGPAQVQYWRSTEQLYKYARSMTNQHAGPWAKLMKMGRENSDYGFWHETFQVKAGNYETIYVNCPPIWLGNCHEVELVQVEGKYNTATGRVGGTNSELAKYPEELGKPDY